MLATASIGNIPKKKPYIQSLSPQNVIGAITAAGTTDQLHKNLTIVGVIVAAIKKQKPARASHNL